MWEESPFRAEGMGAFCAGELIAPLLRLRRETLWKTPKENMQAK
jgi:hypothetical protein